MAGTRIVVVGGGAGGLPLVTLLGRKLGKGGQADITLVDDGRGLPRGGPGLYPRGGSVATATVISFG